MLNYCGKYYSTEIERSYWPAIKDVVLNNNFQGRPVYFLITLAL
jgi:hypothetical protein